MRPRDGAVAFAAVARNRCPQELGIEAGDLPADFRILTGSHLKCLYSADRVAVFDGAGVALLLRLGVEDDVPRGEHGFLEGLQVMAGH